jgi:arylsulfatase A-like enzyme
MTMASLLVAASLAAGFRFADVGDKAARSATRAPSRASSIDRRPNVLMILIDTLRADHMGIYGYSRATTPFIDRLAAGGTVFEQARAQASCTFPSVNSILSGRQPAIYHGQPDGKQGFLPGVPTLQEVLRTAGYRTLAVSSSTVVRKNPGPHNLGGGFDAGFEQFDERCLFRRSGCIAEAALELLEEIPATEAPYFLYAHYLDPHSPYDPPARFEGRFAAREARAGVRGFVRRGDLGRVRTFLRDGGDAIELTPAEKAHAVDLYDEDILSADDGVRVLLEAVERRDRRRHAAGGAAGGAPRDTLVVLVADHGEEFYDHGGIYHCSTTFDELVRTPMIFAGAGVAPGRVNVAAQNVDVMPTILEWVGVPLPGVALDGVSRVSKLRGPLAAPDDRTGAGDGSGDLAFSAQHVFRSITDGTWKLVLDVKARRGMLYHLPSDPAELRDVAEANRREFRRLYDDLLAHLDATEGGLGSVKSQEAMDESLQQLKALGYL